MVENLKPCPAVQTLSTLSRCERLRGSGEGGGQTPQTPRRCARHRPPTTRSSSGGVPPRQLPLWTHEVASVAVRIAFQVILVLWLGVPEIGSGRKLSHDLAWP